MEAIDNERLQPNLGDKIRCECGAAKCFQYAMVEPGPVLRVGYETIKLSPEAAHDLALLLAEAGDDAAAEAYREAHQE